MARKMKVRMTETKIIETVIDLDSDEWGVEDSFQGTYDFVQELRGSPGEIWDQVTNHGIDVDSHALKVTEWEVIEE